MREAIVTQEIDPIREAITGARRAQILDAAVQVFAQKGFHRATVKDIAKAAGVADGTIYNYFDNKEDLLASMVVRFAEIIQFTDQVTRLGEEAGPEQILRLIVQNRLSLVQRKQAEIRALLPQIIGNPELRAYILEVVALPAIETFGKIWQAQADKGQIRQIDPQVVLRSLLGMFLGVALLSYIGDTFVPDDPEKFIDEAIDLVLNGLLPHDNQAEET
jgi:AcrR family transcriptional regulator